MFNQNYIHREITYVSRMTFRFIRQQPAILLTELFQLILRII